MAIIMVLRIGTGSDDRVRLCVPSAKDLKQAVVHAMID